MSSFIEYCFRNWQIALVIIAAMSILPFIVSRLFPDNKAVMSIKQVYQVIFTNWINVLLIFVAVCSFSFFSAIVTNFTVSEALYGAMYLVLGYGLMFWIGFLILIILMDTILFGINRNPNYTNLKLVTECILISSPFIYWLIEYSQWIFLVGAIAFGTGQFFRRKAILKILDRKSS